MPRVVVTKGGRKEGAAHIRVDDHFDLIALRRRQGLGEVGELIGVKVECR